MIPNILYTDHVKVCVIPNILYTDHVRECVIPSVLEDRLGLSHANESAEFDRPLDFMRRSALQIVSKSARMDFTHDSSGREPMYHRNSLESHSVPTETETANTHNGDSIAEAHALIELIE